jgi:6,7-dimethyl-8-ribityllumazine synthase
MTRIAIVAAAFNKAIVEPMIEAAHDEASKLDMTVEREIRVPGSLEIPLVTAALLAKSKIDAVVVLGYIEQGETQHGEVLGHVVYRSLIELQIAHAKPIGIGIIGPGATLAQAEFRKDGYARAAVQAALASVANLVEIETKPKADKKAKKK